jgi:hypothetical protein
MKPHLFLNLLSALSLAIAGVPWMDAAPLGSTFTYQGRLSFSGAPAADGLYDFRFSLHDAAILGAPVGSVLTLGAVPVTNGLFTAQLDFGAPAFTSGEARWLQLEVNANGVTPLVSLNPRQRLAPTPQALYAGSAATANAVAPGAVTSSGLAPASVGAATIADGSVGPADLAPTLLNNTFWKLGGNVGAGSFLGSTDNQPLQFKVNNELVLQLIPDAISPNLIGGHAGNSTGPGSFGSFIGGGGALGFPNTIGKYSTYATIGGGYNNDIGLDGSFAHIGGGAFNESGSGSAYTTMGGGARNRILEDSSYATIAGGYSNTIPANALHSSIGGGLGNRTGVGGGTIAGGLYNTNDALASFIGGGQQNFIGTNVLVTVEFGRFTNNASFSAINGGYGNRNIGHYSVIGGGVSNRLGGVLDPVFSATISGGSGNLAYGNGSSIGGGLDNVIGGQYSAIPGGSGNTALGSHAVAAGRRAKANHSGSFVWADDTDADFASTTNKQFAIRANNGVVIQSSATALDLRGGGALRVAGAGVNTATPIFTHKATAANTSGAETRISHPHCDNKPGAILMVTYNFNPAGAAGVRNDTPVGIYYTPGSRWAIYNLNGTAMPVGAAFNVLVANP